VAAVRGGGVGGRCPALRRAVRVGRALRAAVAGFRRIAVARGRVARRAGRDEFVGRAGGGRSVAGLGDVTGARGGTARCVGGQHAGGRARGGGAVAAPGGGARGG